MTTSESLKALRRANPRADASFAQAVDEAAARVREQVAATAVAPTVSSRPRRRLVRVSAVGAALGVAGAVAAFSLIGSPGGGRGVESAAAAFERAAMLTSATAQRSGTATVQITHDGQVWAGTRIRWHGGDVAVDRGSPARAGRAGSELRVVDGTVYTIDPTDGGWVAEGSTENIDPGSGTTPDEYLAAVREDVGGVTLRRITGGMTGLTTKELADGSTVYGGTVASGLIARETGFKEGHAIRVLPFGYVAHDEAADPAAPLDAAVTVGVDGIVRELAVTWGTWRYTVTYSGLGATPALVAPAHARSLLRERLRKAMSESSR